MPVLSDSGCCSRGIHVPNDNQMQLRFVIGYLDYCDASSSRSSAAECSTERRHASGGARSGTAGMRGLHCRPTCDSPYAPCRSIACCFRLACFLGSGLLAYFLGSCRLVGWQQPSSQQVRQGRQLEKAN
jgi:hypothetical protein